ncbi:hypothetical protein BOX15_Mlig029292g3 [Macrostomum lignano]|uniref:Nucleotide exchange factor SIL1 n=1 Tax=Macrostomum lignano TaxID=282301 RepID=A0A267GED6_9PLAT|nr:hypothetical protein BOX15_Mlig029292g3 [Macrostomum lignano]
MLFLFSSAASSRHLVVAKQAVILLLALATIVCLLQVPASVHCKRHSVAIDTKSTPESVGNDFVATEDWQVVQPGQRIPPGLHVRMNIQTGHTEARLMPPSNANDNPASASNLPALVANDNKDPSTGDEDAAKEEKNNNIGGLSGQALREALSSRRMKEALKKIKAENLASGQTGDQNEESIVQQFRSYEDLKSDFAKINAGIKTDLEVIKELLAEWRRSTADRANRIRILSEFEYHLRQIDNAQNFVQLGGLELLMSQINGTFSNGSESVDNESAAAALRVLAASCQGNAPVQVAAIKAGFLPVLLRAMLAGSGLEQQTRSASVLALASLCRNFPLAQTVLLKSGGLAALRSAFDSRDTDRARVLRIVTLLSDMALEAAEAEAHAASAGGASSAAASERHRQYQQVSVAKAIAETGWCSSITRLLNFQDHDAVEKTVTAMSNLFDVCGREFASNDGAQSTIAALDELVGRYERLAKEELEEEGAAGYFEQMRQRVGLLKQRLAEAGGASVRSEL